MKYTIDSQEKKFCSHLPLDSLLKYKKEIENHMADLLTRKIVDFNLYKHLMGTKIIICHQIINRLSD